MPPLTRSVLYIPASKERALDKARGLPADAIIFDLEDAVAPDEKETARNTLRAALKQGGYGRRLRIVRVNGADSAWGADDLRALKEMSFDAVLLPKVETSAQVDAVVAVLPDTPVWAMIETPLGVLNAAEIAAHSAIEGFVMGTNDLAKELRCRFRADRLPLMGALQSTLLAARAHGVIAVDGVYNAFKDEEGLAAECAQGRDLGFDGKTLIHPAQLAIANDVFSPDEAAVDLARRQIDAYEAAEKDGQGVAVLDGKIVENLHVVTARQILAQAEAIAATAE
ncbi:HpcH/HpaI aldolase/citrate lyase family protein [Falsihalocynthiibacter sp. SS001]|uniref:HpcH/HpaI aldolase/citrate lyase family protein n=1 Tax=Falsihalocynthiibacter sp. SS001 TaxID=3349698 RepID=UPI0036D2BE9F